MALNIPWDWLSVGEAVYLLNSPRSRLEATLADLRRRRAPHPRAAMLVSMLFCIAAWPAFFGVFIVEAVRAVIRGIRGK
jgi:hypothetical protein